MMQLCDEKELDELINKGRKIEDKLNKITKKFRRQKLAFRKDFKKKAKEDVEMLEVKRKYRDIRRDLYDKRSDHIKSIPRFWATAILSFKKHLNGQDDEKIIQFLESVVVDHGQNEKSVSFFFKKNPYFENACLKKIYSHTHKGVVNGTKILWKTGSDTTTGSETALTDIDNSFFTRFFDPQDKDLPKKPRDEVLVAIEEHLWPYARVHFLKWCGITAMGEDEEKKKIALDAIEIIQDNLEDVEGEEYRESTAVERKIERTALEHQAVIEQKCNQEQKLLYQKRDKTFKAIPNLWLFAFLSHHALGNLLLDKDQKIFRFVKSMYVKDEEDVVSGYTITLKFNDNPYFTNRSLTKRISFGKDGTTNLSAVKINWIDRMAITTEYLHDTPDFDTSFFTWFCAPQVVGEPYHDEVSGLIKDELWPNALEYFVNGNENAEDEQPKRRRRMTPLASS